MAATYKTFEGILGPDGRVDLPPGEQPDHPVRVMVTILEQSADETLADLGDYLDQLTDYEDRLTRGEIQWR